MLTLLAALGAAGLLKAILVLAVVGFVVYLITKFIPMPEVFKQVIYVVVAIVVILWLISAIDGGSGDLRFGAIAPSLTTPTTSGG